MTKASGSARSDDCGSLRETGLAYVALGCPNKQLSPAIPPKVDKGSHRGFKHPVLARLLCPIQFVAEFDANPDE